MQAARLPPGPTRNAAEPTAGPNAAATSADTDQNGCVCVGGLGPYALLLETTSEQQRAAAVHHSHVHRVHHVRGGADDVSGLLIAALTASTRANRPWQRRPGLQAPAIRWQPEELLLVSGCSGHADRSGPDVDAAASCSYLSDCMSLSGHRHLLRALCWLAWCSRQTSGARLDRTRRGRCGAAVGNIGAPAAAQRLWFWCKPLGYRQDRLEMRLNQPHDRMPPLRAPILTKMVVSASATSVRMRRCSR